MTYNDAIQIIDSMNVKPKDGYLYYNGMLIGKTYLSGLSEDLFMCDVLNRERIFRIVDLEKELGKAIKFVKSFGLAKKLDKLSKDFK